MRLSIRSLLFCALLLLPVAAFSQGSGSSTHKTPGARKPSANFAVTRTLRGVITAANAGSVSVKLSNRKTMSLTVTRNTRVVGDCLVVGRRVTATYRPGDRRATVIRCS